MKKKCGRLGARRVVFSFEKCVNYHVFPLKNVYDPLKKAITGLKSLWSFVVKNPARLSGNCIRGEEEVLAFSYVRRLPSIIPQSWLWVIRLVFRIALIIALNLL